MRQPRGVIRLETARLVEDPACPRVRVLEEGRRVPLEVQGFLPTERDLLLRLHADDVVAERRDSHGLRDLSHPRLGQLGASAPHLVQGPRDRLLNQVVHRDDAPAAGRHRALRKDDIRVEHGLRLPLAEQAEGRPELLELEAVVFPEDRDRHVAAGELVQVVRDVPRRVEARPVALRDEPLRLPPLDAVRCHVDEVRAVLLAGVRQVRQSIHDGRDLPLENEFALPEEAIESHANSFQGLQGSGEDAAGDIADLPRKLRVAAFEPPDQRVHFLADAGVLLCELVRLHVVREERVVLFLGVRGTHLLRGEAGDAPVHQDHLLADVVHEVLRRHGVPREPKDAGEAVADDRVPRAADVDRPRGVHARVFKEDALLLGVTPAIRLAGLADGPEGLGGEGRRVHAEVHVSARGGSPRDESALGECGREPRCDGLRGLEHALPIHEAPEGKVAEALVRLLPGHGDRRDLQGQRSPCSEGLGFVEDLPPGIAGHVTSPDTGGSRRCRRIPS